jgi:hypothetical protein
MIINPKNRPDNPSRFGEVSNNRQKLDENLKLINNFSSNHDDFYYLGTNFIVLILCPNNHPSESFIVFSLPSLHTHNKLRKKVHKSEGL